jgi:hypothetical protein
MLHKLIPIRSGDVLNVSTCPWIDFQMLMDLTSNERVPLPVTQPSLGRATDIDWLKPGRFALLLAALVIVSFHSVVLGNQTFVFKDYGIFGYPLAWFHRESFWKGELPLWDPLNYCGIPFLAQWNTMVLYPPSLIYLLLPMPWSLSFFCLAHVFWGGLGMYFLASGWTRHRLAGAFAGIAFAFSGMMLSSLIWPSQTATFAWVPWVIWGVRRSWSGERRLLFLAVIIASMQMLAGGAETILFTWLILAALATVKCLSPAAAWGSILLRFGLGVFLVTLLCSAQLLPFLQLLGQSQRDTNFGSDLWSMPWSGWTNFLVPLSGMVKYSCGVFFQPDQQWVSSYYAGIGTVLLAVLGVCRNRNRQLLLMLLLCVLGGLLALGEKCVVYRALHSVFPPLGFIRYPIKFLLIPLTLLPVIAAFGVKTWIEDREALKKVTLRAVAMILLLMIAIITAAGGIPERDWSSIGINGLSRAGFLVGTLALLVWGFKSSSGQRNTMIGLCLVALLWLDLITQVPQQNPTVTTEVYSPDGVKAGREWAAAPTPGQSRAMVSLTAQKAFFGRSLANPQDNYLLYRLGLFMNCNLLESIPQVHGFFALIPSRINTVTAAPWVWPNEDFTSLLNLMGVAQVSSPARPFEWESRQGAMPLVTLGQQPVFADDTTTLATFAQTNINFRTRVYLPVEAQRTVTGKRQENAKILGTDFSNGRVSVQTEAPGPTMLVAAQTDYPGWKAYVDGKPAQLWRANYAFQALEVPGGNHRIELRYQDPVFRVGLALSGLGVALCVALWFLSRRKQTIAQTGPAT